MKRVITFILIIAVAVAGVALLKQSSLASELLWNVSGQGSWLLPLVLIAAILDSVHPCSFSILLITIAFLFGLQMTRKKIIQIGGTYIAGIFTAYLLIGLGILRVLHIFNTPHFMAKVGAILLIVLGGINLIKEFFPAFPIKLGIPQRAHRKMAELMDQSSVPTAFLLGGLVGLCEFPCTGGPYLMVLGLLHDQRTYLTGVGYLLLYNLIFVLPLVIILLIASDNGLLEKVSAWKKAKNKQLRVWGGVAMIILGLLVFAL